MDCSYRASGPIFVRQESEPARLAIDEIPEVFRNRLLSLRGYDQPGELVTADVISGNDVEEAIERFLSDQSIAFIDAHNAKPGCFAARISRAS
jgi:hypothetical protein